jgi:hypothetical protein
MNGKLYPRNIIDFYNKNYIHEQYIVSEIVSGILEQKISIDLNIQNCILIETDCNFKYIYIELIDERITTKNRLFKYSYDLCKFMTKKYSNPDRTFLVRLNEMPFYHQSNMVNHRISIRLILSGKSETGSASGFISEKGSSGPVKLTVMSERNLEQFNRFMKYKNINIPESYFIH